MRRGIGAAVLSMALSCGVVAGGWFMTKYLLECRQARLLAGSSMVIYELEDAAEVAVNPARAQVEAVFVPGRLSEGQLAEILSCWEKGGKEIPREPSGGQMDMEQAVAAGKQWLRSMAQADCIPAFLQSYDFVQTQAKLCTLERETEGGGPGETLLGMWQISYTAQEAQVSLRIHAMTGQIWSADIRVDEELWTKEGCDEMQILEKAFPFLPGDIEEKTDEESRVLCRLGGGPVCAALRRGAICTDSHKPMEELRLFLQTED